MKKVLIEISEKEFEHLQSKDKFEKLDIDKRSWLVNKVCNLVKDGKVLSDLTNGEIVNTLFDIDEDVEEVWGKDGYMYFKVRANIWDAPYEGEKDQSKEKQMRYVTFFYNSMTEKVSDLKVHENKGNAARYFNENGRKYFNQFTPITIDTLPASVGSLVHKYYIATVEDFEEAFNCNIDEALKSVGSEE